jgi:hypothetical protein
MWVYIRASIFSFVLLYCQEMKLFLKNSCIPYLSRYDNESARSCTFNLKGMVSYYLFLNAIISRFFLKKLQKFNRESGVCVSYYDSLSDRTERVRQKKLCTFLAICLEPYDLVLTYGLGLPWFFIGGEYRMFSRKERMFSPLTVKPHPIQNCFLQHAYLHCFFVPV